MGEVQVCIECGMERVGPDKTPPGTLLFDLICEIVNAPEFHSLEPRKVACLGNCDCECRVALADPDRWSWMLGDVDPGRDAAFLKEVIGLWVAAPNGLIPKAERPQALKEKSLGRIPPTLKRRSE